MFGALQQFLPKKVTVEGVDYCSYEGKTILPSASYKEKSSCSEVNCNKDFSMTIERFAERLFLLIIDVLKSNFSCGVYKTDKCERFEPDFTLDYPECCNKVCVEPIN